MFILKRMSCDGRVCDCLDLTQLSENSNIFIKKSIEKHDEKYCYKFTKYSNNHTKITFLCKEHIKTFEQRPDGHLNGGGCSDCKKRTMSLRIRPKTLTTEIIIDRFIMVHGHRYIYVRYITEYIDKDTLIEIYCKVPDHGFFKQRYYDHMTGHGCPRCNGLYKTTQIIKNEFKEVHDSIYGYEEVVYVDSQTPVKIFCNIHGYFLQTPTNHLQGYGCQKCGGNYKKDTEYAINECIEVHGYIYINGSYKTKYLYDRFIYTKAHKMVEIGCRIHGYFIQAAYSHKSGRGCNQCKLDNACTSLDNFIQLCCEVHEDFYNYDRVCNTYRTGLSKIEIKCPEHGYFIQEARIHLNGHGCRKCADKFRTQEEIIVEFQNKYGFTKFNYSMVDYVKWTTEILIGCTIEGHGFFFKTPSRHLAGSGCPKCCIHINQTESIEILERLTGLNFIIDRSTPFLKNSENTGSLRYDCYNEYLKLALEYNGKQHYEYIPHFHRNGEIDFINQQKKDKLKRKLSKENNIYLIEISYKDNKKEVIENQLFKYYHSKIFKYVCLEIENKDFGL